jgi:hypothetical protein
MGELHCNIMLLQKNIGLHFENWHLYSSPVSRSNNQLLELSSHHYSFDEDCHELAFSQLPSIKFHWFLAGITHKYTINNIRYYPVISKQFNQSLISDGIITGGDFETH